MSDDSTRPIVIKRKKVVAGGGAWWRMENRLRRLRDSDDGLLSADVAAWFHGERGSARYCRIFSESAESLATRRERNWRCDQRVAGGRQGFDSTVRTGQARRCRGEKVDFLLQGGAGRIPT